MANIVIPISEEEDGKDTDIVLDVDETSSASTDVVIPVDGSIEDEEPDRTGFRVMDPKQFYKNNLLKGRYRKDGNQRVSLWGSSIGTAGRMESPDADLLPYYKYDEETDSVVPSKHYIPQLHGSESYNDDVGSLLHTGQINLEDEDQVDSVLTYQEGLIDTQFDTEEDMEVRIRAQSEANRLERLLSLNSEINPDLKFVIPEDLIEIDDDGNETLSYDAMPTFNLERGEVVFTRYQDDASRMSKISVDVDADDWLDPVTIGVFGDNYVGRTAQVAAFLPELAIEKIIDVGGTVAGKAAVGVVDLIEETMTMVGWSEREADEDLQTMWNVGSNVGMGIMETAESLPMLAFMKTPNKVLKEAVEHASGNPHMFNKLHKLTETERKKRIDLLHIRQTHYTEKLRARENAQKMVEEDHDFTLRIVKEWEEATGQKLTYVDKRGVEQIDYDAARDMGQKNLDEFKDNIEPDEFLDTPRTGQGSMFTVLNRETRKENAEIKSSNSRLQLEKDLMSTSFDSETIAPFIAVARSVSKNHPIPEGQKVTDWLFDRMVDAADGKNPEIGKQIMDNLSKYDLSWHEFTSMMIGSSTVFGKGLAQFSQLARFRPATKDALSAAKNKADMKASNAWYKAYRRMENVRRGLLVGTIGTHIRNLESGLIRAPFEGLRDVVTNAVQSAAYAKTDGKSGLVELGKQLSPVHFNANSGFRAGVSENWTRSFGHIRYMLDRSDDASDLVKYILSNGEMKKQYSHFYTQVNDINDAFGRGEATGKVGKAFDKGISEMEDIAHIINTTNRLQDVYIREAVFLSELENSMRVEWGVDFVKSAMAGRMHEIINSAPTIRKEGARSFEELVAGSVDKAMRVTYAAQPEFSPFRKASQFITETPFGTVLIPFPRFMFSAMELVGNSVAGAPIATGRWLARKGTGKEGFTDRELARQMGTGIAGWAGMAAMYMYRSESDKAGAKFNEMESGDGKKYNMDALFPFAQFALINDGLVEPTARWLFGENSTEEERAEQRRVAREKYDAMSPEHQEAFNEMAMHDLLAYAARMHIKGEPVNVDLREWVSTITGTNFRAGNMSAMLQGTINLVNDTVIPADMEDKAGVILGTLVGEYAASWLQPLTMGVKLNKAIEKDPDLTYYDHRPEPAFKFFEALSNSASKPFKIKGFGWYNQDRINQTLEAMQGVYKDDMTDEQLIAYNERIAELQDRQWSERTSPSREVAAKRGNPIMDFLGTTEFESDTPQQFFLKRLGMEDFDIGGRTGLPSVDRQINEYMNDVVPQIVGRLMRMFATSEQEWTGPEQKAIVTEELKALRSSANKLIKGMNPMANEYLAFKNKDAHLRGVAISEFREKHGRDARPDRLKDLIELNVIAASYRRRR